MRLFPNALLMLVLFVMVASCEKDTEGDGLTCDDLTDDVMIIDGKAFTRHDDGATICVESPLNGGTRLIHNRTMIYGSGSTLIMPLLLINLSSLPPVGQTTTYTVDNGSPWAINGGPTEGRALVRVDNHEETAEVQENYYSYNESGTIDVTVSADGIVTYNFSILLTKGSFSTEPPKRFCAKNLRCQP